MGLNGTGFLDQISNFEPDFVSILFCGKCGRCISLFVLWFRIFSFVGTEPPWVLTCTYDGELMCLATLHITKRRPCIRNIQNFLKL